MMNRWLSILLATASMSALWAQGSGNASLAELGAADSSANSPFLVTRTLLGKILWLKKDSQETLIVVEDSQGHRGVFTVNKKTRFKADRQTEYGGKKHISADDLAVGEAVKVTFVPDNGRVVQLRFAAKA